MDIVDKFCRYFCENNLEKFLSLFAEDTIYVDCLYGKYKGIAEIEKFYKRCHIEAKNYVFTPKNKIFSENEAAFEWDFSFLSNMSYSKGKKIEVTGCSFISLKNGKISYYRDYSDSIYFLLQSNVPEDKILKFYRKKYSTGE